VCDSTWGDFVDNAVIFGNEWESWNVTEVTTDEATTEEATTEKATTAEITTEEATTEEATTEEATTEKATTEEATTQEPTTEEQTTQEPTTEEQTTEEATTSELTTPEVTTSEATTSEPTTESTECARQFTDTIIQADLSIRLLDSTNQDWCAFKKYTSFVAGDEIWYAPCDVTASNANRAGKYTFAFDAETGLVSSVGASELFGFNLCWQINSMTRFYKQRVVLADCDPTEPRQIFQVIEGRLHMAQETRICLGHEEYNADASTGIAMTVQDCYVSAWGDGVCSDALVKNDDSSIRPFGDSINCLFKKYTGYNVNDEVWVRSCDAGNTNQNKAQKFWWSHDHVSGLITSEGSRNFDENNVLCLTLNSLDRFYKQRVKLAVCDADDELQQFDFVDGRIYSRGNTRLCAGYEYSNYVSNGVDTGSAFIFSTCYPNTWAIDIDSIV
jgi:hypothetical protein